MADTKISGLAAVTDVQDTDEFVLARAGATKKATGASMRSQIGSRYVDGAVDTSTRTLTALNTWEDVSGTSITFTAKASRAYLVTVDAVWQPGNTDWLHHYIRVVADGATTGVLPVNTPLAVRDSAAATTERFRHSATFVITGLAAGSRTVKVQTFDSSTGLDRTFTATTVRIVEMLT